MSIVDDGIFDKELQTTYREGNFRRTHFYFLTFHPHAG